MGKYLNAKQRKIEKKLKNQQLGMTFNKHKNEDSIAKNKESSVSKSPDNVTLNKLTDHGVVTCKTKAKAMGLKSTLVFDDKIVVTSFLNSKNEENEKSAHIEKISDYSGKTIAENPRMFTTTIHAQKIELCKDDDETNCPNPAFDDCGKDYIKVKDVLEKRVFGRNFINDNLHIQIAYNIFDIKKIIGTYINNIIYIFYNLGREEYNSDNDIIGAPTSNKDHRNRILNNTSAYFTYFDGIFQKIAKDDSDETRKNKNDHNALVLGVLSYLRQFCMHGNTFVKLNEENFLSDTALYNAENFFAKANPLMNELIDNVYAGGIKSINSEFIAHAKNNMYLICNIYNDEPEDLLLKQYYDFVVRKEGNNLGLNTRQIREVLIDKYLCGLRDKKYDTFRNKVYTVLGFILVKELKNNSEIQADIIAKLRANQNGDEGKINIYEEFTPKIWSAVSTKFTKAVALFDEEIFSKFKGCKEVNKSLINKYGVSVANTDEFVKILYFLCKFLDGKEINELCCTIINKFDSINDLIQTALQCGETIEFVPEYNLFSKCKEISSQIRVVKNISKMKPELSDIGESLILDAVAMLGYKIDKFKLDANGNRMLDSDMNPIYSDEYVSFKKDFFDTCELDEFGRVKLKRDKPIKNHRQRNFIINNVISSKWFFYVAKYNRPSECVTLMKNKKLIGFTLKDVPDTQIIRYYRAVTGDKNQASIDAMRATIIDLLHDFSVKAVLREVGAMTESENRKQIENSRKEQMKAIVKLYLTVAYLITKSMVKVNTRFSIAFSAYERDVSLFADKNESIAAIDADREKWGNGKYIFALTKCFLDADEPYFNKYNDEIQKIKNVADIKERTAAYRVNDKTLKHMHFNLHSYKYVKQNYEGIRNMSKIISLYRNLVQHLTIVTNMTKYLGDISDFSGYYSLYCYILQRLLLDKNNNDKLADIKDKLIKFGTYNKDFMWMLNVPFAYNLARYKNLSNEVIFYDKLQKR